MTEYDTTPGTPIPEPTEPTGGQRAGSDEAWGEVTQSLDELGKAVSAWARAVSDDPTNRRRATQLRDGLDQVGRQLGEVVDSATRTDFAQQLGAAAMKTGDLVLDTARRVGDEVAPHLAGAFKSAATGLRQAAEKMEEVATRSAREGEQVTKAAPSEPQPSPTPAPYTGEAPPAPAPSGIHEGEDI